MSWIALALATNAMTARAAPDPLPPGIRDVIVLYGATGDDVDPVRLVPPPAGAVRPTPLGAGWRHDFDLVLTSDARDLIVYDELGTRRRFAPTPTEAGTAPQRYVGRRSGDGEIVVRAGTRVWRRADAGEVTFRGSQPVGIASARGDTATLRYHAGRLVAVIRDDGRTTTFEHAGGGLVALTLADGTRFETTPTVDGGLSVRRRRPDGECRPDDALGAGGPPGASGSGTSGDPDDERDSREPGDPDSAERTDERCDTANHPPGADFANAPGIPGAIRVDARPASCRSYFVEHYGTERGTAIEQGLEGLPHYTGFVPTVGNFPVADFVGHEIRVVRSRDLSSPTYDAVADGLYERLLRDGREIAAGLLEPLARDGQLDATELGRTTTLVDRPDRRVVLELVVRHGLASADQRSQIARAAAELLTRYGVVLRVVEIP